MSRTQVIFYQGLDGRAPVLEWIRELRWKDRRGFAKCFALIDRLHESGRELRRPTADFLKGGIHELRGRVGRVNYRILYFFHGPDQAVLVHGLTKQAAVPVAAIERSLRRKFEFEQDPIAHTYEETTP